MSFEREYESKWSGTVEDAFFSSEAFDRNRILRQPEYEASGHSSKNSKYILSVDVGRRDCDTVVSVIKVTPQPQGTSVKTLVNMYTLYDKHFEDQAIELKRLYYRYKASVIVIDANGLGVGLVDYMVRSQVDPDTGETLVDFGVVNDEKNEYRKFKSPVCEDDAMYLIKANAVINTEAHANLKSQLNSSKVKFLIDEKTAKMKLLDTKLGKAMDQNRRSEYLRPFTLTSILKEELLNLREENEGINIKLKPVTKTIKHDKVSSLEYGLYYIKLEIDDKKQKRKFKASDWSFLN